MDGFAGVKGGLVASHHHFSFFRHARGAAGVTLLWFLSLQAADLSKPIDKRIYKGTQPTCHDFNHLTATAESVSLLVGFSAGQVQLIDPIKKETSKLFNEEVRHLQRGVSRPSL